MWQTGKMKLRAEESPYNARNRVVG